MKKTYIKPALFSCMIAMEQHLLSASEGTRLSTDMATKDGEGSYNNDVKYSGGNAVVWDGWE